MFEREKTENHHFLSVAVLAKLQELFSSLADKGTGGCFLSKMWGRKRKKKKCGACLVFRVENTVVFLTRVPYWYLQFLIVWDCLVLWGTLDTPDH